MIKRLYIHNFRCLENFELPIAGRSTVLLIGKNGAGKTTIALALSILQKIARGTNRIRDLVGPSDLSRGRADAPVRFELEVELEGQIYGYTIAFEFPKGYRELRVFEEKLTVDGQPVYTRNLAQVHLSKTGAKGKSEAAFFIDWHLVALPIVQQQLEAGPIPIFKQWLSRMLILRPVPSLISGDSTEETLQPSPDVTDLGDWFSGLIAFAPAAYSRMAEYLKQVMPDLGDIQNRPTGADSRRLFVNFSNDARSFGLPFKDLSDGEKCFMICALVLAANSTYGPLLCFWDEPDNYLALSEVGHFITALRKAFQAGGQLIATSHNEEAIRRFSQENTLLLYRKNHFEPTLVRPIDELEIGGDLVSALIRDDIEA